MQIDVHKGHPRGITQLMYVGDDGAALEQPSYGPWWALVGGFVLAAWLLERENRKRR